MAKLFYSIGEVAEALGENPSCIRYWSNCFADYVRPARNAKGDRKFRSEDLVTLQHIQFLLKNEGLTIEGAKKQMKNSEIEDKRKIIKSLKGIKSELLEIKKFL